MAEALSRTLSDAQRRVISGIRPGQALEKEIAEMRRQIAELKAEAAQADNEDDSAARSGRS